MLVTRASLPIRAALSTLALARFKLPLYEQHRWMNEQRQLGPQPLDARVLHLSVPLLGTVIKRHLQISALTLASPWV